MSVTGTHIWPALGVTENLQKYWILKLKTASNLKPFLASAIEKRKHLTLNLKPEMASENRQSGGQNCTSSDLLASATSLPTSYQTKSLLATGVSHRSSSCISTLFGHTQTMTGHMNLTTKRYQLQGGTGRVPRLVCKITLRLWIQNLVQRWCEFRYRWNLTPDFLWRLF